MSVIRVEFFKQGNAKYISHLDLIRTIQRAARRADIPVEYSRGFNPHSKISYGPALSVGVSSSREYFDIELDGQMDGHQLVERLNAVLPAGLGVTAARYMPDRFSSLASIINAAYYTINGRVGFHDEHLEQRLICFFSAGSILIQKTDKKGRQKQVNIVPMILGVEKKLVQNREVVLEVILQTGSKGNLNPAHLMDAIQKEIRTPFRDIRIHREKLLVKRGEKYFSPMEIFD